LAQWAARIGTFDWNIRTGVNTWTPELEAIYGLLPGGFGGTLSAFENLVHPDDRGRVMALVDETMKTGQPTTGEWRIVWPDGSVHWVASRAQAFRNEAGEPSRMVGVNIDITEPKLAEKSLKLFRTLVDQSNDAIEVVDPETLRLLDVNDKACQQLGYSREELLALSIFDIDPYVNESVRARIQNKLHESSYAVMESVHRRKDGSTFPVEVSMKLVRTERGYIVTVARDITERKRAEEALSDMTRKLIESQEQERARIGRELHDDINQRIAMLALELEQLKDNPSEVERRVQELRRSMAELSNDVQALSHDLHSSKLEYLGVVSGMRSWCKEFAERQKLEIDFRSDVSSVLPLAVGLSLFRVLQEALHNAMKHSGVKRVEVELREDSGDIHLLISDLGRGFDVAAALQGKGLGLTSMRERLRLVNGTISIVSKPMGGTAIHVRVPLGSEKLSQRAVG